MTNVTNSLLAQMLMAQPDQSRRPTTQLANVNVQERPTELAPTPSWDDSQALYYWYKLLNGAPLRDQGMLVEKELGTEMLNPAPFSSQPEVLGDPSRFPRRELFDRRFRPQER